MTVKKGFYKNDKGIILYIIAVEKDKDIAADFVAYHVLGRPEAQVINGVDQFGKYLEEHKFLAI